MKKLFVQFIPVACAVCLFTGCAAVNRNDQQKQIVALTEQQNAEFAESVSNYSAKFQLLTAPTMFPTP